MGDEPEICLSETEKNAVDILVSAHFLNAPIISALRSFLDRAERSLNKRGAELVIVKNLG
jgi:hypothetical protein